MRFTLEAIPIGSNHANSRATVVVVGPISVSAPPMIPARPIGTSRASQISSSPDVSERVDPVERRQLLAVGRRAHSDPSPTEGRQVVGVVRLVELEHHVVADVDDVVDRSLTDGRQPGGHPRGARGDDDPGQDSQREAAAALPGDDLDRGVRWAADRWRRGPRRGERQTQLGGQIAGDTDVAEGVGAVAGDVDVEHDVVDEAGDVPVGHAEGRVGRQHEDAAVVAAEPQLVRRAEHAVRRDAEDASRPDRATVGHRRADGRQRDDVTGFEVRRAAPHVVLDAVARVDPDPDHLGRVGVPLDAHHPGGDHAGDAAGVVDVARPRCRGR